jgi:perosamine synthetase
MMTNTQLIPWAKPQFWGNEQSYVSEALTSTWISGGPFIDRFETDFADYVNTPFALTTSNGTSAIHMAYLALGLKPGDEVIIPGFSFLAAANLAIQFGAKPVFAEVNPDTWLVSASEIEKCLSPKTKIIVPIHSYGNVCEMDKILTLADNHGIPVVEDTAEAFASRYNGRQAGTMSTIGTFSFQATKTITTGEGGMVITQNEELYKVMALYRSHGMLRKIYYWHELPGHNFRLTNLQAALGCAQLKNLKYTIRERNRVYKQYKKFLLDVHGIRPQHFSLEVEPVLWAMAVKLDRNAYPQGRDRIIEQMTHLQIETRPGFYAPSFMEFYSCPRLPVCEEISQQVISLPTFPALQNEQIEYICNSLISLQCGS